MTRSKDKAVGYGYVGEWDDGTLGWCLPKHLAGWHTKNFNRKSQRRRDEANS
jgi:hypothetical protein